jgi:hypothetical protein
MRIAGAGRNTPTEKNQFATAPSGRLRRTASERAMRHDGEWHPAVTAALFASYLKVAAALYDPAKWQVDQLLPKK